MMGTCQIIGDSGYVWFLKCDSLRKGQVCSSTGELGKRTWPLLGMLESAFIQTKLCERHTVENSIEGFCNIHSASSFSGCTLSEFGPPESEGKPSVSKWLPRHQEVTRSQIATSHVTSGMFAHRPSATGGFTKIQCFRDNVLKPALKEERIPTVNIVL